MEQPAEKSCTALINMPELRVLEIVVAVIVDITVLTDKRNRPGST